MKDMRIIDCHMHTMLGDGDLLVNTVAPYGFERFNLLSCSCADGHFGGPLNNLACMAVKAQYPDQVYFFNGVVHPREGEALMPYEEQVKLWQDAGADGVKFVETKPTLFRELGKIRLNSPEFDPMWSYLEREEVPILWHVGDPQTFWSYEDAPGFARDAGWLYLDDSFPSLQALFQLTEDVLARHPKLNTILAHFYFVSDDYDHAVRMMEDFPAVCFDLTPGTEMFRNFGKDPEKWRAFFLKYASRILFGTDIADPNPGLVSDHSDRIVELIRRFLEADAPYQVWDVDPHGIGLPDDALRNIYAGNFERLTHGRIKPINKAAAQKAVDWTLDVLKARGDAEALKKAEAFAQTILK